MTTIDRIIIDWFNTGFGYGLPEELFWLGNILLILLSLVMAALCSGLIGFEREYNGHAAGLRTHLMVAIGSALIMIISIYGFSDAQFPNRDPARLAAQVVPGIGFLGAGTIIQTGTDVKGLTTATTIWVTMAIGLACGSGNFIIAISATAVALVCLIMLRRLERAMARRNPMLMIVVPSEQPVIRDIILAANRYNIKIRETQSELLNYQENSALRIVFRMSSADETALSSFLDEVRFVIKPLELKMSTDIQ